MVSNLGLSGPFLVGEEHRVLTGTVLVVVDDNHEVAHMLGQLEAFDSAMRRFESSRPSQSNQ